MNEQMKDGGAKRFVIEGEWSGYRSGQQRVVHRSVHPSGEKRLRAWADKTHAITYTDGTRLILSVRDCKPRERVEQQRGYMGLIHDCAHHDVASVEELSAAVSAAQARRAGVAA